MTMKRTLRALALIVPPLLSATHPSAADEAPMCAEPHDLDKYKLLRRLSLDLRQQLPSFEEYQALDNSPGVPDEVIESYLRSTGFQVGSRRFHENKFWPNVSNVRISVGATTLTSRAGSLSLADDSRALKFRGDRDARCLDVEQTAFDPAFPGEFRPVVAAQGGLRQEGYRMVQPYWAPKTTVKVCAFDAQESKTVTKNGQGLACNTPLGRVEPACGCGPNLRYCFAGDSTKTILSSMREQLGRLVDRVSRGDAPYTDLLLAREIEEDGPLSFFRKHLAPNSSTGSTFNEVAASEPLREASFADATWKTVQRSSEHAGALTTPAFLLRFQTNRGRANRVRIIGSGQFFVPPEKLAAQAGCSDDSADLTKRCYCQTCHQVLEPLAAQFGNFAEAGSALISDRKVYPTRRPNCEDSKDPICRRFYVTNPDEPNVGSLLAYQFTKDHPEYEAAIESGPRALAQKFIDDGSFARTTVTTLYERLMKREMRVLGEEREDEEVLDLLVSEFKSSGYNFPTLVRSIVKLPEYRRVR
jgi:hypothetical protein